MTMQYRVWNIMNVDREGFGKLSVYLPVSSPEEAVQVIDSVSKFQLQIPERLIGSNVFGLECRNVVDGVADGEWYEWSTDEFNDVDELADFLGGQKDGN